MIILRPEVDADEAYDEIEVFDEYKEPSVDRVESVRERLEAPWSCGNTADPSKD